jgi:uroporphyrinogen decarboxylase
MRQAGRYLPEYRAIRAKYSFLQICDTPELAIEVSLQPFRILGVDAVIVFSDILIPARAMGLHVEISEAGPVLPHPIRSDQDLHKLRAFDPEAETRPLLDTLRGLRRALREEVPILGFGPAPWTLACYQVEGHSKSGVDTLKQMIHQEPVLVRRLLEFNARCTAQYLRAQLDAGATAVQLFDTWAGELSLADYTSFAFPATQLLLEELRAVAAPTIHYARGASHLLSAMVRLNVSVLSVDWRVDLREMRETIAPARALQGNIDPCVLFGSQEQIRLAVLAAIDKTRGKGHILNLGHGILPTVPVENAQFFVSTTQAVRLPCDAIASLAKTEHQHAN